MTKLFAVAGLGAALALAGPAQANQGHHGHGKPYVIPDCTAHGQHKGQPDRTTSPKHWCRGD